MLTCRLILTVFLTLSLQPLRAEPLVVFAAASLKGPLDEIASAVDDVVISYDGSGAIARQVLHGAPADIVVLAHPKWMDVLQDAQAIRIDTRTDLLGNRLVLVRDDATAVALTTDGLQAALGEGRLAIGLTKAVPAGQYGRAALESLGLWDAVKDQLAEVTNVRAALALVARGEAPLGLVYASDAQIVPGIAVVAEIPAEAHEPIRYVTAATSDDPRSAAFLARLVGPDAQAIFAAAGFIPLTNQ